MLGTREKSSLHLFFFFSHVLIHLKRLYFCLLNTGHTGSVDSHPSLHVLPCSAPSSPECLLLQVGLDRCLELPEGQESHLE